MQRESLVQKRLNELGEKGQGIAAHRKSVVLNSRTGRATELVNIADAKGWGTSVLSLLRQAFGESSVHAQQFATSFANLTEYYSSFAMLYSIFAAAKEDFEGGYIFSLRGLVKAEVLTDALEQAQELLTSGYKDPACVLVGVSLEIAVKELASRHSVPAARLDKMNTDLCKAGAYNIAKQKQITAWADLRNKAAHGDWTGYSKNDVTAMHAGVQQFVADFL
jgi:hypothetical protein